MNHERYRWTRQLCALTVALPKAIDTVLAIVGHAVERMVASESSGWYRWPRRRKLTFLDSRCAAAFSPATDNR